MTFIVTNTSHSWTKFSTNYIKLYNVQHPINLREPQMDMSRPTRRVILMFNIFSKTETRIKIGESHVQEFFLFPLPSLIHISVKGETLEQTS